MKNFDRKIFYVLIFFFSEVNNENYFIFLMDSQGLFAMDHLRQFDVFVLSYLLSISHSCIYNIKDRLNANECDYLNVCI